MNKYRVFLKKVSYTITSNAISLIITSLLVLFIPKYIGVESYGYWQLYTFYASYTAYLSFGLTDGIFIRYASKDYESLNYEDFRGQFWFIFIFNLLITASFYLSFFFINQNSKTEVLYYSLISALIIVPRSLITFTLQATGRVKEFSIIIILEKIFYLTLILGILSLKVYSYKFLIFADLLAKSISLLFGVIVAKELVVGKISDFKVIIDEAFENFVVGYKILLSNLSGILIVGINRGMIQRNWSIKEFGKISLALSLSNIMSIFTNAVSIVFFPILNEWSNKKMRAQYKRLRTFISIVLMIIMSFYFVLKPILELLLPEYIDSIKYMSILIPIILFESKSILLTNNYLKVLRQERSMLIINFIVVGISFILSFIFAKVFHSIVLMIIAIPLVLAIRSIILETYLITRIKVDCTYQMIGEILIVITFSTLSWYLPGLAGFCSYGFILLVYILLNLNSLKTRQKNNVDRKDNDE